MSAAHTWFGKYAMLALCTGPGRARAVSECLHMSECVFCFEQLHEAWAEYWNAGFGNFRPV
eukprot:9173144-Alexandrium_andersonii.AAC.1